MDYNSIYYASFEETINLKQKEIISTLKESKENNKNFLKVSNNLKEQTLKEKESCHLSLSKFSDLYSAFKNRHTEYESDHLQSFFQEYSNDLTKQFVEDLGRYEGLCIAEEKFQATEEYLETVYVLGENYDQYILNFSPHNNPVESALFYKLKLRRYPDYGKETGWEAETLRQSKVEELKQQKAPNKKENIEKKIIEPGSVFDKSEKRYILHLLYELLSQGSEMKASEFMRILHLSTDIIDTSAGITGNPPHYRQVHEGFPKNHPKNKKIKLINGVISKIQGYQLPKLKQILNDKLIALNKAKPK